MHRIDAAKLNSLHDFVALPSGAWHCKSCLCRSSGNRALQPRWLRSPCDPVETEGGPHRSHHLCADEAGCVWCQRCGTWSTSRYRSLLRACGGQPKTGLQRLALRRFAAGQGPPGAEDKGVGRRRPAPADELFVVGLDGSDSEAAGSGEGALRVGGGVGLRAPAEDLDRALVGSG